MSFNLSCTQGLGSASVVVGVVGGPLEGFLQSGSLEQNTCGKNAGLSCRVTLPVQFRPQCLSLSRVIRPPAPQGFGN